MTLNNDVRALTRLIISELELMTCNEPRLLTYTLSAQARRLGCRLIGIGQLLHTTDHSQTKLCTLGEVHLF